EGDCSTAGSFSPIQRALFECVDVAHHQDRDEAEHAPENQSALFNRVFVNYRPRIHEHDFKIEENEEHRHQIELYVKARMLTALRHHPTFTGGVLRACPS